jgi:hypothetical protein
MNNEALLKGSILEAYHQPKPIRKHATHLPDTFAFQWQFRRKLKGGKWRSMYGADSATLEITPEMVGHEVRLIIHNKN